jgi:hypothetical protein
VGVGGQRYAPAALPLGMIQYPLYRRLGRPQGWCGRVLKISPPPGFDPRTVQLIASRYFNYAILAHRHEYEVLKFLNHTELKTVGFMCCEYSQEVFEDTAVLSWQLEVLNSVQCCCCWLSTHKLGCGRVGCDTLLGKWFLMFQGTC